MSNKLKKAVSSLLVMSMMLQYAPMAGFAADVDNLCEHHAEHTAECGYVEGESDCIYYCDICLAHDHGDEEPVIVVEQNMFCTGVADCQADSHSDTCVKKLVDEKTAADQAAVDAVAVLIAELPDLEQLQLKPMAEQQQGYLQVQEAYDAYCALTVEQQVLLPDSETVFKPYFEYFNSLVSLLWYGAGTASNPYSIRSEEELRELATQVNSGKTYSGSYFRLDADIALTSDWIPIGNETRLFQGNFDGNGKTISGMKITGDYAGLFGHVGAGTVIKNLKVI